MKTISYLPWEAEGTIAAKGGDLHARATSLAVAAMEAASSQSIDLVGSDYARAQADYAKRVAETQIANARHHVEANNARANEAIARKAARQAAHEARNALARAEALRRKNAKAA